MMTPMRWLGALVALVLLIAAPRAAAADACDDCEGQCRRQQDECKKAAPKPLCKGPAKMVCEMFKNFQCPAAKRYCIEVGCGVGGPCGGGPPGNGGRLSGDPHLSTLDQARYDLQTAGEYLAAHSEKADVTLQVRFVPRGDRVSMVTAAAVESRGHVVAFLRDSGPMIDSQSIEVLDGTLVLEGDMTLSSRGKHDYVMTMGESSLWIRVGKTHLNIYLVPAGNSRGSWTGLLGNFDGQPDNDFVSRDGTAFERNGLTIETLHGAFSDSWRLSQDESLLPYGPGESTETFTDEAFPRDTFSVASMDAEAFSKAQALCQAKGVRDPEALRNCIYDIGVTGDEEFAESAASEFPFPKQEPLLFAGNFGARAQGQGHQGQEIPVFWSGVLGAKLNVEILDDGGKKAASTWTKDRSPVLVRLPAESGAYTLRVSQGDQAHEQPILVTDVTATLDVPETVVGATEFEVDWTGPEAAGDYVSFSAHGETRPNKYMTYHWATRARPRTFKAPASPGKYDVHYVLRGGSGSLIVATRTVTVTPPSASLAPPASVEAGEQFEVGVEGPLGTADFVDITDPGETNLHKHLTYEWAHRTRAGKLVIRAPKEPGVFSMRYLARTAVGNEQLADATLKVVDVTASLTVPKQAAVEETFDVSWKAPGRTGDYVTIAKQDSPIGQHMHYVWAARGTTGGIRAPKAPGTYEVRYVMQGANGRRILTRETIEIVAK